MTVYASKPEINVREKLKELDKPSGVAGEAMLRAETPQEQFNLIGAGRKNLLINGNFDVAQRGTSKTGGFGQNVKYLLDRWSTYRGGWESNITVSQQVITGQIEGSRYCIRVGRSPGNTSTSPLELGQQIEERNTIPIRGMTVTASFYIRVGSNYTDSNVEVKLYTTTGGDLSTAGNSSGSLNVYSENHDVGTEWRKITISRVVPSDAGSLHLGIRYINPEGSAAGSNDYFEVAQAQVEVGKIATPFEHRSYGEELALCQRYSQVYDTLGAGVWNSATSFFCATPLPVAMREVPSISMKSGTYSNINIEHVDTYDITGVSPGHASSAGEDDPWEVSTFITVFSVSNSRTVGDAGVPVCDQNNDYFILDAEL